MARDLQLRVVLSALDKATAPIRAIMQSTDGLGKQLKQTRDQLRAFQEQQKNIQSFKALHKASRESEQALNAQQQKIKELSARMRETGTPTKAMTKEFQAAAREAHRLKQSHSANQQQLQQMRSSLSAAGISTKNLGSAEQSLRQKIQQTNQSLADQQNRLKRVGEQHKRLAAAKSQYEKTQQLAGSMAAGGAAGLGVGYGVKNIAQQMLAPGVDYGAQMSELQAVSRLEKDDERFKLLKQQARDLGASTAFSATEVGAGQTFLARAGFSPEAIRSSMKDILDLALANGADLARTADIASNISGAFKIDPEVEGNMQRVADVLSGVSARANVDLEMLGDTMKYLGKAEGLGLSLEESAAMAGILGNIGIQSSQAGTTMRAMLDRLSAPATSGAKAMKALGLNVKDAAGNMRGLPDIIADVAKATEKMGNVDQAKYLQDIFGAEAGSGMAELVAQQGTGALTKLIDELYNVQGENSRMAATRADNIDGDLKSLFSAWEEIGIGITDINEGPLRGLIQQVTGILRATGEWAQRNPELVATLAKVVAVIGILSAAGGALMLTLAGLLGPIAMLRYGIAVLGIKAGALKAVFPAMAKGVAMLGKALLTTPLGLFVAASVVAVLLLIKHWEPLKQFFVGLWNHIKEAFNGGLLSILALIANWSPLGLFYKAMAAVLNYFGFELPGSFTEFGAQLIERFIGGVSAAWSGIAEFFTNRWADIKSAFDGGLLGIATLILNWSPLGLFYQVFAAVFDWFGIELPGKFTEFGGMLMSGLINGIKGMAGSVKDAVVGVGESTVGWFKDKLGIRSPSRVFAEMGSDTAEGLAVGLAKNQSSPLKQVASLAKQVMAAGAITLGLGANVALAEVPQITAQPAIKFDAREPLSKSAPPAPVLQPVSNITIHVHAAPGMDERALAQAVQRALSRAQQQQQVRNRSRLGDLD